MVIKTHPTVVAQQNRMLHHRGGYHARSCCEGARGLIGSKKLDAQVDARRGVQRDRFAKTTPGSRSAFPFARDGYCPHREHAIQHVASDEGMWGTSVTERHATKRRKGVRSPVIRDLVVKEASSSVLVPPMRQPAVF